MELYTSKLNTNQTFKNYKALCECLNEPVKNGCAKKAQLKEWERYFSFEKNGQKITITEIFDTPKGKIDNRINNGGYNTKNVQPMMDYIMSTLTNEHLNEYMTISNWSAKVLELVNTNVTDIIYDSEEEIEKFCVDNEIEDVGFFKLYLRTVKFVIKKFITSTFNTLAKRGHIVLNNGYKFAYNENGSDRRHFVSTDLVNNELDTIERELCAKLLNIDENVVIEEDLKVDDDKEGEKTKRFCKFKDRQIKGKQLLFFLQQEENKELYQTYLELRNKKINTDENFKEALNSEICYQLDSEELFIDGENVIVSAYYPAYEIAKKNDYEITNTDKDNLKQEIFNIIKKLAERQMGYIKRYDSECCEYTHPYTDFDSLDKMRKINNILLKGVIQVDSIDEIIEKHIEDGGNWFDDIVTYEFDSEHFDNIKKANKTKSRIKNRTKTDKPKVDVRIDYDEDYDFCGVAVYSAVSERVSSLW